MNISVRHEFQRDRSGQKCSLCHDEWPCVDELVHKHFNCLNCGMCVDSECQSVAMSLSCPFTNCERGGQISIGNVNVTFVSAVLNFLTVDSFVFAKCKIGPGLSHMSSVTSTINNVCTWDTSKCNKLALQTNLITPDSIEIEICTRFMGLFDNKLAHANIALKPLMNLLNTPVQRKFQLTSLDHRSAGHIELLLNLDPECVNCLDSMLTKCSMSSNNCSSPIGEYDDLISGTTDHDKEEESIDTIVNKILNFDTSSFEDREVGECLVSDRDSDDKKPEKAGKVEERSSDGVAEVDSDESLNVHDNADEIDPNEAVMELDQSQLVTPSNEQDEGMHAIHDLNDMLFGYSAMPMASRSASSSSNPAGQTSPAVDLTAPEGPGSGSGSGGMEKFLTAPLGPDALMNWVWSVGSSTQHALEAIIYDKNAAQPISTALQPEAPRTPRNKLAGARMSTPSHASPATRVEPSPSSGIIGTAVDPPNSVNTANQAILIDGEGVSESEVIDECIGTISLELLSGWKENMADAADGDHYVLATLCCGEEFDKKFGMQRRSATVFGSATPIFNCSWKFQIPHFRSFVKLELMDAVRNKPVGECSCSVYSIIQRDSDLGRGAIHKKVDDDKIIALQLKSVPHASLVGHLNCRVAFTESTTSLFLCSRPIVAPAGPPEDLSMERLTLHIARFQVIIDIFNDAYQEYLDLMNWNDVFVTGLLFAAFLYCCILLNAEYALCCPMLLVVAGLTVSWYRRNSGHYVKYRVEKLDKEAQQSGYVVQEAQWSKVYQPVATVRVSVLDFEAKPLQLSASCHNTPTAAKSVTSSKSFDASAVSVDKATHAKVSLLSKNREFLLCRKKRKTAQSPVAAPEERLIGFLGLNQGTTMGGDVTSDNSLLQSLNLVNITNLIAATTSFGVSRGQDKSLFLQNVLDPWPWTSAQTDNTSSPAPLCLLYPILQPLCRAGNNFLPWTQCGDSIVVMVYSNSITLGCVEIPLSRLVSDNSGLQPQVYEWFPLTNVSPAGKVTADCSDDAAAKILLRLQIDLPTCSQSSGSWDVSKTAIDTSIALQYIMSDLSSATDRQDNTISTIWNMRDNVKYVQNLMSWLLDAMESFKNIFNWTVPTKTNTLYIAAIAVWLLTAVVPGRYIILSIGLYQFLYKFIPNPGTAYLWDRFNNSLQSIPNDDDLAIIYEGQRRLYQTQAISDSQQRMHAAKLNMLLPCRWQEIVTIKISTTNVHHHQPSTSSSTILGWATTSTSTSTASAHAGAPSNRSLSGSSWQRVYLVLQGNRLVWWNSLADIENFKPAEGQLLLFGHCGVTQPSPVDAKELGASEDHLVAIFGKDSDGCQQKCTIWCQDAVKCQELHSIVSS